MSECFKAGWWSKGLCLNLVTVVGVGECTTGKLWPDTGV